MSHLSPGIILFEKRPRWESELKRGLSKEGILIRPCRSSADLTALCRGMRRSVAVIDFETGPALVVDWLQRTQPASLGISPVILLPRDSGLLEWPLRELGASSVLEVPIRSIELVQVCRSLLDRVPH